MHAITTDPTNPPTPASARQRTPFSPPSGRGEGQRPTTSIVRSRGLGDYTRRGDDLTCSDRPIAPTPYGKGAGREAVHTAHLFTWGRSAPNPKPYKATGLGRGRPRTTPRRGIFLENMPSFIHPVFFNTPPLAAARATPTIIVGSSQPRPDRSSFA